MDSCSKDGNCFFSRNIRTILQIIMLSLLFTLQIQSSQSAQILFTDSLVDCRSSSNSLSIVVSSVCPPVGLHLDITKDHVFDWNGKTRDFPGNVCLPTSPGFRQVLKDCSCLVLLNSFRHHVNDVMHDSCSKFQIKVRLHSLFRDSLSNSFTVSTFKLTREKVSKPSL